jgi:hypothetical protein
MDNIKESIQVSSMRGGDHNTAAVSSLYHLLARVYVPLIRGVAKEGSGSNKGRKSLEDNLYALRSTLYMLERQKGTNLAANDFNPSMCGGISEPIDEIRIWEDIHNSKISSVENERLITVSKVVIDAF